MGVAIGNVLGSNIVNICLILGICFLLVTLKCPKFSCLYPSMAREEVRSLYFGLFVSSIIPLSLLYLEEASRYIGVILLTVFVVYLYQLARIENIKEEGALGPERQRLRKYAFITMAGIAGVVAMSYFIVDSASYVAKSVWIPPVIIGATVIASAQAYLNSQQVSRQLEKDT